MATYFDIFGQKVQYLSSDPSPVAQGQVWYNSSTNTLKVRTLTPSNSYASTPALNTARSDARGGGSAEAAFVAAGDSPSGSNTEKYDGSSWTSSGSLTAGLPANGGAAGGSQTAGWYAYGTPGGGGASPPGRNETEHYNGTAWTAANNSIATFKQNTIGLGPQTAGIAFGGFTGPASPAASTNKTTEYNGTSWTTGGDMNQARQGPSGAGGPSAQTACLAMGGMLEPPGSDFKNNAEEYNGSAWTNLNTLNTARGYGAGGGTTARAVMVCGRGPSATTATETWDGSCFSTNPNSYPVARTHLAASGFPGSFSTGIIFAGGNPGPHSTTSNEWSFDAVGTQTVTTT